MMGLRRGLLLVALCLLASAATAHAACAWVLWAAGAAITGTSSEETWDPVGSYESLKECESIAQRMENNLEQRGYVKTQEGLYVKKTPRVLLAHGAFKCLPDALDPRP